MVEGINLIMEERSNVKIVCRVRPPNDGSQGLCISDVESSSLKAKTQGGGSSPSTFEFDHVLGVSASQSQVYEVAAFNLVEGVLAGYDGALLCYGQTGSGKTYTLEGSLDDSDRGGVLPRAAAHIFDTTALLMDVSISVSFVEIYLEKVHDLLCIQRHDERNPPPNLGIRSLDSRGPKVQNCCEVGVNSCMELLELARLGTSNRHVAATEMNHISSRSHSIFGITIKHVDEEYGRRVCGTLHLVDLAGSERQTRSRAEGKTLDEARTINRSLSALGDVIVALTQVKRGQRDANHVPYRNSKLTLLLREAFGRSSNSVLILHISPEWDYRGETVSTLRFGSCAMCVENNPRANIKAPLGCVGRKQKEKLNALGDRLSGLRARLGALSSNVSSAIDATIADAQEALMNSQVVANECFDDKSLSSCHSQSGCFDTCSELTEDTMVNEFQSNLDTILSSLDDQLGKSSDIIEDLCNQDVMKDIQTSAESDPSAEFGSPIRKVSDEEREHVCEATEGAFAQVRLEDLNKPPLNTVVRVDTSLVSPFVQDELVRSLPQNLESPTSENENSRSTPEKVEGINFNNEHLISTPEKVNGVSTIGHSHNDADAQLRTSQDMHLDTIGAKIKELRSKLSSITSSMDTLALEHSSPDVSKDSPSLARESDSSLVDISVSPERDVLPEPVLPERDGSDVRSTQPESEAPPSSMIDADAPSRRIAGSPANAVPVRRIQIAQMIQSPVLSRYVQSRGRSDLENTNGLSNDAVRGLWKVDKESSGVRASRRSTQPQGGTSRVRRSSPVRRCG